MIILLELLMVAGVLLFIGRPIFVRENDPSALITTENEHKEDLLQKKEYAFETLSDLDLDFKTGKISKEDFNALKKRYEHEAIKVLREIDHLGEHGGVEAEPQREGVKSSESEEEAPEPADSGHSHFCTKCGSKAEESDKFCNQCGQKL